MSKLVIFRKQVIASLFFIMTIFRALQVVGFRGVVCPSDWLTPTLPCIWGNVVGEVIFWGLILGLMILELNWDQKFKSFFFTCKAFWFLFLFIILACLSLIWSISFMITLYKVFTLIATTLVAIYISSELGYRRFVDLLAWFFMAVCLANFIFVLVDPKETMWAGKTVWNGIFWHKIYLGSFMTFAVLVFLIRLFNWKEISAFSKIINGVMLFAASYLLFKSSSVTAIITITILFIISLLLAIWLRWNKSLKQVHYLIFGFIMILIIGLVLFNFESILNVFGKNSTLTGRIPMWSYLLKNAVSQRPFLGYGYGAFWHFYGFREQMTHAMNFTLQVSQSDNGFMEILLHLGIVGLVLLIALILIALFRSIKYFNQERTMLSALPLLILFDAILVNCTVSMLIETDCFVWGVVVASQVVIPSVLKPVIKEKSLNSLML